MHCFSKTLLVLTLFHFGLVLIGTMSWLFRPTFKDNAELINHLVKSQIIKTKSVINAMLKVDRKDFAPSDPYNDSPQYLGHGATISAPHMHGYALEYLQSRLKPGNSVLDVGSGSGILCAYMAHMVLQAPTNHKNDNTKDKNANENTKNECENDESKSSDKNININENKNGKVVGVEHIDYLVDLSLKNLNKDSMHKEWLENANMIIIQGDGRLGYPKHAPYDCIHVGAAAQPKVVNTLFDQLKDGGMLVIPVEVDSQTQHQVFRIYEKDPKFKDDKTNKYDIAKCKKDLLDVMYVPLTDKNKQKERTYM